MKFTYYIKCVLVLFFSLCFLSSNAQIQIEEILTSPDDFIGLGAGSVAFADIDGDDDQDFIITGLSVFAISNPGPSTMLYINESPGFTESTGIPFVGLSESTVSFVDIDGDDDMDLFLTGIDPSDLSVSLLYSNDGLGNFSPIITDIDSVHNGSVAFSDIDDDNDLDLLLTGRNNSNQRISKLYLNDGDGNFSEVPDTPFPGIEASTLAFSDIDGDGDEDLLLTGRLNSAVPISRLYVNDGNGNFSEQAVPFEGVEEGAVCFADIDGDDDQDVFITGLGYTSNGTIAFIVSELFINDGLGNFTEVSNTNIEGVRLGTAEFSDIDGDNDQDLLITGRNAIFPGAAFNRNYISILYLNDGTGNFTELVDNPFIGVQYGAVATVDFDGDSDQDIFIAGQQQSISGVTVSSRIYQNVCNDIDIDGICDEDEIPGCLNPEACNYNADATDEATCLYIDELGICGGDGTYDCPDINAFVGDPCDDGNPNTSNEEIDENCNCQEPIYPSPPGSGGAMSFDGTNDYLSTNDNIIFGSEFSAEAWIKLDSPLNVDQTILGGCSDPNNNCSGGDASFFEMSVSADGELIVRASSGDVPSEQITMLTEPGAIVSGKWIHVAAEIDFASGVHWLYINGRQRILTYLSSGAGAGTYSPIQMGIGAFISEYSGNTDVSKFFHGTIDEVRIFSAGVSDFNFRNFMCQKDLSEHPQEDELFAYYRFDDIPGNPFAQDLSNSGYNLILNNMDNTSNWVTSGAPIGDVSGTYVLAGMPVDLPTFGQCTPVFDLCWLFENVSVPYNGIYWYQINEAPNNTSIPAGFSGLDTTSYIGIFLDGPDDLFFDLKLYDELDFSNALSYKLARRSDNSAGAFQGVVEQSTTISEDGDFTGFPHVSVFAPNQVSGEYIFGYNDVDCLEFNANIGDPCDDSIPNSYNDSIQESCTCEGITEEATVLSFDGDDDYIIVDSDYSTEFGTGDFTVEFWMYLDQTNSQGGIASTFHRNQGGWGFFTNFSTIQFAVGFNAVNSSSYDLVSGSFSAGNWVHVAGVRENDELHLYINGNLVDSEESLWDIPNNDLYIGRRFTNLSNFYEGFKIDELRVWNYALGSFEIEDNLNCQLTGNEDGLVRYYRFNQGFANSDNSSQLSLLSNILDNPEHGTFYNLELDGFESNFTTGLDLDFCQIQPVFGCTDPGSCEYNPEAEYDDGSCATYIGDTCDDGNELTENDILHSDCTCVGTVEFDCPELSANIGDSCDDGNPNTTNETVQPDCTCLESQSNALHFDGIDDYVEIPADETTNFGLDEFSVEFWLYQDFPLPEVAGVVTSYVQEEGGWTFHNYGNEILFFIGNGISNNDATISEFPIGQWVHIAGVRQANMILLYVNGVLVDSTSSTRNLPNLNIELGRPYLGIPLHENLKLDEFRIWNYAINENQVNDRMNCELTGNESGLVRYYKFNQGIGNADNSSETQLVSSDLDNPVDGNLMNFELNGVTSNFVNGIPFASCSGISEFDCPELGQDIGDTCDDGNPNTTNETIQPDCTCQDPEPLALFFDGTDDFVQISQDGTTDFDPENFTVEFWVQLADTLTQQGGIATSFDWFEGGWAFNTDYDEISFVYGADADFLGYDQTSAPFPINTWVHVTGVKENNTIRLYMNGVLVDSAITEWPFINKPIQLGRRFVDNDTNYESFKIDEFRVWNFARSESEINDLMNCQLNGTESGLVRYYRFNQGIANGNNGSETSLLSSDADNLVDGSLMNFELNGNTSNFVDGALFVDCSGSGVFDCPNLNANIGDPCDDGDPSTNDDIVLFNCQCAGTLNVECPDLNANIGEICDDGNPNTENDLVQEDCTCEGESVFDCPELNANIGNGCDDGDPNTINDIVLEDCTCAGIQDFDCPDLSANIGDLCNDGDSDTNNDTVQPDCSCEGTLDFDCLDLSLNIGDACDDGNPNTENDAITVNCTCAGIPTVASISGTVVWSSDCGPRDLTMQFYEAGTNNLVHSSTTLMEADGSFELPSVPLGTYDIFLKIDGTLQEELLNQEITNGTNATDFGEVILGDLNGDNGINIVDFSVINSAFGSAPGDPNYNPLSDMNCDDGVNIIDFSVLNAGFGLAGASPNEP